MKCKALSLSDIEKARQWRNEQPEILRTSFPLTAEMQEQFYRDVVCNRQANARFWGIWIPTQIEVYELYSEKRMVDIEVLIGMAGLENIQWENRLAEISLILNPDHADCMGEALRQLLHEGFNNLNMENIYTEVYEFSPYLDFWLSYNPDFTPCFIRLPNRKYYRGRYYDSFYINFNKERYNENTVSEPAQKTD